jgi:phosphate-selective porin OprO/OprP
MAILTTGLAQAEEAKDEEWKVSWKNGVKIERNDGFHEIKLGGRIMVDFAAITGDDINGSNGTGAEVRRARIFTSGKLYDGRIFFKLQFDFADDVKLKDAYLGFAKIPVVGQLKVGHYKEPFSLEHLGSSKYITFMERSLADDAFVPARNMGITFNNQHFGKRLTWAFGGFRETNDSGMGFDDNGNYDLTGRLTGAPVYANEGRFVLHLGTSYSHQFRRINDPVEYDARPESHLSSEFLETGDIPSDGVDKLALEAATVLGPVHVQSEYMLNSVSRGDNRSQLHAVYAEAGWFITGEHRRYSLKNAAFQRVSPKRPFLQDGGWGAWQIAVRYSYLDMNDGFVIGGKLQDWTIGLNWLLFSNTRIMTNYVHANVTDNPNGNGTSNIFQMRFQIDY